MERVWSTLESMRGMLGTDLCGIGVGCTGPVDPVSGLIGQVDFLPGWNGHSPVAFLGERSGLPVALENDADAAALGEHLWGAGRGRQSLICVTVGTGIGGGIVLNGALYRGVGGSHPELGHHVIDELGPPCFCGARGCWESLASGPALVRQVLLDAPPDFPQKERVTAEQVFALARRGESHACRAIAREAHYLGVGIANLVTLFVPELIVLTGSIMKSADLLLPAMRDVVQRHCGLVPAAAVEIQLSALGTDAPLIGAAAVWHHRYQKAGVSC
jgi:glucokinase